MNVIKLAPSFAKQITTLFNQELDPSYLVGSVYSSEKLVNYIAYICEQYIEQFFGIVENDKLLAVVQCKEFAGLSHINNIVVSSSHQRQGFGKILISWIIEQANQSGVDISLNVDPNNLKAKNWYFSEGFKIKSESSSSTFELHGKNVSKVIIHDDKNVANFGFSDASIDSLEFFYIEPNVFRLKSSVCVDTILLDKLNDSIKGYLVANSTRTSERVQPMAVYQKTALRMIKYLR